MRLKTIILLGILTGLLLAGCAAPQATQVPVQSTALAAPTEAAPVGDTLPKGTLFEVVKPDGTRVPVTVDQLKTLPLAQLTAEGKVEEGPRLSDVLTLVGVTEYTSVAISGTSSPATLTREQVEADAVLDFTNHGTVKLSTNAIPKADWTKDVSLIEVK